MRVHAGRAVLLTLVLVGAGCLGLGSQEPAGPAGPAGEGGPEAQGLGTTGEPGTPANLTAFTYEVEAAEATLTANGTFEAIDACLLTGCLTGSATQAHDVSELVSTGVPVRLTAELRWDGDATPFFGQSLDLGFLVDDGDVYTYEEEAPEDGVDVMRTIFVASAPSAEVLVFHNHPGGNSPATDYTLSVEVQIPQSTLVPGIPTQLDLETGQGVFLEAVGEGAIDVAVYNPEDSLVAHLSSERPRYSQVVPPEAPTGSYVLVATEGSGPVRIATNGTAGPLVALERTFELADPREVEPEASVSWSFDLQGSPLQAGLYTTSDQEGAVTMSRGNGMLAGPNGTLAEGELGCGTCLTFGGFYALVSPAADPGLVPGTYQASYTAGQEAGTQVGEYIVRYQRR